MVIKQVSLVKASLKCLSQVSKTHLQKSLFWVIIILRGWMSLRAKSVNTLCNKILFTLKIEKNIPNKMAQTRVFYLILFPKYWRFRTNFESKDYTFKSLRLTWEGACLTWLTASGN